jgi:hypothetical protein
MCSAYRPRRVSASPISAPRSVAERAVAGSSAFGRGRCRWLALAEAVVRDRVIAIGLATSRKRLVGICFAHHKPGNVSHARLDEAVPAAALASSARLSAAERNPGASYSRSTRSSRESPQRGACGCCTRTRRASPKTRVRATMMTPPHGTRATGPTACGTDSSHALRLRAHGGGTRPRLCSTPTGAPRPTPHN